MEENKKVFIRGRKGRGDEIKDILTGLGAEDIGEGCDDDECVYYISHDNQIVGSFIDTELAQVIMDNYKEIELPRKWKDGDILIFDFTDSCTYAVFKKYAEDDTFESYILVNDDDVRLGISCPTGAYRLANEEEKEDFRRRYNYLLFHLKAAIDILRKDME